MAFDTYLVIDGIKGEATGLKEAIEIFSFSWGASNPVTIGSSSGGASAGKVSISSFNIMKKTDAASTGLFLHCCQGSHIKKATVHMRKQTGKGGQQDFLVYTFEEVFVDSIQWSGSSGGDDTPTESVSFAFAKVHIEYKKQKPDGTLEAGGDAAWDITKVATK
jgi:type VI secretion system secreted protein Hcp